MDQKSPGERLNFDAKILNDFLYALNILRRQIAIYPTGHPVIQIALQKLLQLNQKLLEFRSNITIGIARDTLLVENHDINPRDPVLKDLAKHLFAANIASMTINSELTAEEICRFFELLAGYAAQETGAGTADTVAMVEQLGRSGVRGIVVREIDFSLFHRSEMAQVSAPKSLFAESETAVLWKGFAEGLSKGVLDPHGVKTLPADALDSELLAEVLNRDAAVQETVDAVETTYENAITTFLAGNDRNQMRSTASKETLGRLDNLIDKLNPELRLRFLNSTLKVCAGHRDKAEEVLSGMPQAALLIAALERTDAGSLHIPRPLLDILGKIAAQHSVASTSSRVVGDERQAGNYDIDQLTELFQADHVEDFVAKDYQDALNLLAAVRVPSLLDPAEIASLSQNIEGHSTERQFCNVLLELLRFRPPPRSQSAIIDNLAELTGYFLQSGDFLSVVHIRETAGNVAMQATGAVSAAPGENLPDIFPHRNSSTISLIAWMDGKRGPFPRSSCWYAQSVLQWSFRFSIALPSRRTCPSGICSSIV